MRRILPALLIAVAALAGCGHGAHEPPPTDPQALGVTLDDLAAFGPKHAGTAANDAAADYVRTRMEAAGLQDVHLETFSFPRHVVGTAGLAVAVDGTARQVAFDVFEASGNGHVTAPVVWVGAADAAALAGVDLTGKIAFVQRVNVPHRAAQYRNVIAKGAVAMLYASAAPENLPQVGSVRFTWEATGAIPAITIGKDDADALHAALDAGKSVVATVDVDATVAPATGHNVLGTLPGRDPTAPIVVVGAHYDTWFAGSVDNGGGVAAMLALAERLAERGAPRATIVFAAWDGEELGLYGGYDWLRKHVVREGTPVRMTLDFEVPASADATVRGLAHSPGGVDASLADASLRSLYTFYTDMGVVPQIFGGIIPTDIQGFYRAHVPTASTACDSAWYHTTGDTPDKVDVGFLAKAVDAFDLAVRMAEDAPADGFSGHDAALWTAATTVAPRSSGDPLVASVLVTDSSGMPQAGAAVTGALLVDDFFLQKEQTATTDSAGRATFTFPASEADAGAGSRWLHVTSGPEWPLVESITPLP